MRDVFGIFEDADYIHSNICVRTVLNQSCSPESQRVHVHGVQVLCPLRGMDKMMLSSFGTAKGYPVVVHCADLQTEIRNGDGNRQKAELRCPTLPSTNRHINGNLDWYPL
jgi:hypothetical protein